MDPIWKKYESCCPEEISSTDQLNGLALTFCKDIVKILQEVTLLPSTSKNSKDYGLDEAPIVGLLTRIAKLFEITLKFYELDNGEFVAFFSRPLVESSIIASYLLREGDEATEDFRKCSYKETLRVLREAREGSEFYQTNAGRNVLRAAYEDLALEGFSESSFSNQKRNRWRLQNKTFYKIYCELEDKNTYSFEYGMGSESIHWSWNESVDWCLATNSDGTFSANTLYIEPDVRLLVSLVRHGALPCLSWLDTRGHDNHSLADSLEWALCYNRLILERFDQLFDGP